MADWTARDILAVLVAAGVAALLPLGVLAGLVSPRVGDVHWTVATFYGTTSLAALFIPITAVVFGLTRQWALLIVLLTATLLLAPFVSLLAAYVPAAPQLEVPAVERGEILARIRLQEFFFYVQTFAMTLGRWALFEGIAIGIAAVGVRLLGLWPQRGV